jgi:hypothetical protein
MFSLPARVSVLWVLMVPVLGMLGAAVGTWPVPMLLVAAREGWAAISGVPVEFGLLASLPEWVNPKTDRLLYLVMGLLSGLIALGSGGLSMYWGTRAWEWLVVTKLRWVTDKELDAVNKRGRQLM